MSSVGVFLYLRSIFLFGIRFLILTTWIAAMIRTMNTTMRRMGERMMVISFLRRHPYISKRLFYLFHLDCLSSETKMSKTSKRV
jgi:hypothetical protein